ncbi:FtsX-like permease family protein, partial [Micrococcus luteus]|nr:FtsX-like permease family protein [Micrococcus luteus]
MWTVALSQLRTQPRRYVSLVLAILIGTLFLAASFLVSSTAQATLRATLGSTYAGADLVVLPGGSEDVSDLAGTSAEPGPLARLDGVEEAYALRMAWATARAADAELGTTVMPLPRDPALAGLTVAAGALPAADDARGVTLDAQTADRHGVAVGDVVTLASESGPDSTTTPVDAVVTGLTEPSPDPMLSGQAQVWASPAALTAVQGEDGQAGFTPHLLLRLAEGADVPAVAEAARAEATAAGVDVDVATPDEAVRSAVTQLSGGTDLLGWVLGGFAALALLVTALVIANTFQVLVAQRTRDLALLRTIGSTTAQVRASVLTEAAVVGVVGSVLGAGLAVAIVAGVAAAARAMLDLPFLTFGLHPVGLAVSVAVGVAVTVLAALA